MTFMQGKIARAPPRSTITVRDETTQRHHSQGRNRSMRCHSLVVQIGQLVIQACVTDVSHMIEMASKQCDDKDR